MRTNCFRTVGPFLVDSCIDENGENMGHFYFARHGQTVWNVENKICGATDIGLTENGRQQARYVSEITGIPARVEPRLMEQNFGKYESTPRDGAEFREAKKSFVNHYDGGESMLRLCQRIYNLLDDIKEEADEKVYLLVAHNGISRAVQSYFYDMTNDEFAAFGIKNCEIRKYEFRG